MRQSIKYWAEDDRPREKLKLKGKHVLSNAELLAILLGAGTKNRSALEVAQMVLNFCDNDLNRLGKMSIQELQKIPGIGEVKAMEIIATMELARRKNASEIRSMSQISSSKDAFDLLQSRFMDLEHEEFYVIYLNRANAVLGLEQISKGGVSGTIADGKIIFSHALRYKASGLILSHNHPSGNVKASYADIKLTKNLLQFGKMIDVHVLDHLIIATNSYFSFMDEGVLNDE